MRSALLCLLILHAVPALAAKPIVVPLDSEARAKFTRMRISVIVTGRFGRS